jgi:DNA-binding LytR/AlgR family response regulator
VLLAIQCSVNALSFNSEHPEMPAWHGWTLEMTSAVGWLLVTPLHWRLVRWLTAHTHPPLLLAGVAIAASVVLSLIHVATMMSLRVAIFATAGGSYDPSAPWSEIFLYEFRKDASSLLQIGMGFFLIQWFMRRAELNAHVAEGAPQPRSETIVEVQDGASLHFVPLREIDQVGAAGNYVEIPWRGRTLLHRTTLSALEDAWAPHGFVRIHRSILVRGGAVVGVVTLWCGDFTAELAPGVLVRGSRRHRAALDGALQAP